MGQAPENHRGQSGALGFAARVLEKGFKQEETCSESLIHSFIHSNKKENRRLD